MTSSAANSVTVNERLAQRYGDDTYAKEGVNLEDGWNLFEIEATQSGGATANALVQTFLPTTTSSQ